MKTMTCKQLGGACDKKFKASTFEEIAEMSKNHGIEMFNKNDAMHLKAMKEMKYRMKNPADFQKWFASKKKEFDDLTEE